MKHKEIAVSLLITLMMIFGMVMPVAAQDGEMPVNCNGLSDADCAILTEATTAMQGQMLHSITVPSASVDVSLEAGSESIMINGSGSGRMVIDEAVIAMFSDVFSSMATMDMTSMQDFDLDAVIAMYEQLDADMIVQAMEGLGMAASLENLSIQAPGEAMSLNADIVFKDMGLYLHTSAPNGADAWFGEELEITMEMKDEINAALEEMIASLQSAEMSEMEDMMGQMEGVMDLFMPLAELANSYVTVTRGEDVELFGQTNYAFTTSFDLNGFLADQTLPGLLMAILEDPMLAQLSEEEMGLEINESQIQFVLMTVGMILGETNISTTQWIGADDMLTHKVSFDLAATLDLSLMGDPELTSVVASASGMMEFDGYNTTTMDDVEVPADYYSMDMTGSFLAGGPEQIEGELALGESFSGSFSDSDSEDIFAINLSAGQTASLELESEDYPYLTVYGPDGFEIGYFDLYYDEDMTIEADADGTYLIKIEGYWDMDYDLTVRAQ